MLKRKYLEQALSISQEETEKLKEELRISKHNNELLIKENLAVREENKDLRYEKEELKDVLNEIEKVLKEQDFNSIVNLKNKIKSILTTVKSI